MTAAFSRWGRSRGLRWTAWAVTVGLLGFHARLLVGRLANGSLAHPEVALQWGAALVLLAWLWRARRHGISVISGRRALAFWVLVLLLHAVPAMPGGAAALQADGGPVLLVAPLGLAVAGAVALLARLQRPRSAPALAGLRHTLWDAPDRAEIGGRCSLVPRAPPA